MALYTEIKISDRDEAFERLLRPLVWDWSSSIDFRIRYVSSRKQDVILILPFLKEKELKRAEEWLREAADIHSDLCD